MARDFGRDKIDELQHDALGYVQFRVKGIDLDSTGIIAREKLVKELSAVGERISDPTRRSLFFQEAAEALRVDMSVIARARPTAASQPAETARQDRHSKVETEFLSLLLNNPGAIDTVFERIAPDDFDSSQLSRLYSAMITQYETDGSLNANRLIEHFQDEESISLLTGLAAIEWSKDTVEHETKERTRDFIDRKQKRIRSKLQQELARAEAEGDQQKAEELLEQLKQHGL